MTPEKKKESLFEASKKGTHYRWMPSFLEFLLSNYQSG